MSKTSAALVIGLCSHGLSVVRALHKAGVTVFVIEKNQNAPGVWSNSIEKVFPVLDFSQKELLNELPKIRKQLSSWEHIVLFATNDNHVKFISENSVEVTQYFKVSWLEQSEDIRKLLDKTNLEQFCINVGLNYPKTRYIQSIESAENNFNTLKFPIILKPAKPLSSFKTLIAYDELQAQKIVNNHNQDLPLLVQEYISGGDTELYFCALTLQHGKIVQSMVGQKLASYPPARGQTTIAQTTESSEAIALTARFFSQFSLSGPVSLEFKKAPDGSLWVIEPTVGRTDFWSELCIQAGFNQPYQEFLITLDQPMVKPKEIRDTVWFDCQRDPLNYLKACWATKSLLPFKRKLAFTYFNSKDLGPFIKAMYLLTKRVVFKK